MNKIAGIIAVLCACLSGPGVCWTQVLLHENFDYPAGNNLTDHAWTIVQGGNSLTKVASVGLSYTGYIAGGIGSAAQLDPNAGLSHEDYARSFTSQTSGSVYVSFLINAAAVDNNASFNFPLYVTAASGTGGWGRVYIDVSQQSGGSPTSGLVSQIRFGLSQFTESPVFTPFIYSLDTTYLIVLKYTFVAGENNDQASLFVFSDPNLPATEPQEATLGPVASNSLDAANITRVVIRRAAASNNAILLDGIRVSPKWAESPLPVELVSFTSLVQDDQVTLSWRTATETNNFGFEVERRQAAKEWQRIAFIPGNGTTSQEQSYLFVDEDLIAGSYEYRLRQIDTDGSFEYSGILKLSVGGPVSSQLLQNYPNPFNPSTSISYSVQAPGRVLLKIFDISGRTVRTLVNENRAEGEYSELWNGRDDSNQEVASGLYFYNLQAGPDLTETRRMVLLK